MLANTSGDLVAIAEIVSGLVKAYDAQIPINLSKIKQDMAKKHRLGSIPKLVDIIAALPEDYKDKLLPYIKAKPVRTASGVAVVAVMSKPHRCPHIALTGNVCSYCPGGVDSDFEYSTQAYTGYGTCLAYACAPRSTRVYVCLCLSLWLCLCLMVQFLCLLCVVHVRSRTPSLPLYL